MPEIKKVFFAIEISVKLNGRSSSSERIELDLYYPFSRSTLLNVSCLILIGYEKRF